MLGHNAISESPISALGAAVSGATTVSPSDTVVVFDSATVLIPRQTKAISDRESVSDAIALQLFVQLRTIAPADREQISDAVFLQHLMRDIRVTDIQALRDQVAIQHLAERLYFFDTIPVWDTANLTIFSAALAKFMAGIRTFTCTPGYEIQREAITKTYVADFDQPGLFSVMNGAARPAYKFTINIAALTRIQAQSLSAFHFFHQGAKAFYVDGFVWSAVSTLNLVGEGTGTRKEYFLPNRNIDPNSITVAVFNGSVHSTTTAYSLNASPGVIAFTVAPGSGTDIEASHGHKYKVVFEPDGFKIDEFAMGVFRAQLKLRELAV